MKAALERRAEHQIERIRAREARGLPTDASVTALHDTHTTPLLDSTPLEVEAECAALLITLDKLATEVNVDWSLDYFALSFTHDRLYRSDVQSALHMWLIAPASCARQAALQLLDCACIGSRPTKIPGGTGKVVRKGEVNFMQEAIRCLGGPDRAAKLVGVPAEGLHHWVVYGWQRCPQAEKLLALAGIKINDWNSLVEI